MCRVFILPLPAASLTDLFSTSVVELFLDSSAIPPIRRIPGTKVAQFESISLHARSSFLLQVQMHANESNPGDHTDHHAS